MGIGMFKTGWGGLRVAAGSVYGTSSVSAWCMLLTIVPMLTLGSPHAAAQEDDGDDSEQAEIADSENDEDRALREEVEASSTQCVAVDPYGETLPSWPGSQDSSGASLPFDEAGDDWAGALLADGADGDTGVDEDDSTGRSFSVLFFGAGLVALAGWALNRRRLGLAASDEPQLRHVQSLRLGSKHQLAMVEVDGKRLLLGVGDGGVTLLSELADADPATRARLAADQQMVTQPAGGIEQVIPRSEEGPRAGVSSWLSKYASAATGRGKTARTDRRSTKRGSQASKARGYAVADPNDAGAGAHHDEPLQRLARFGANAERARQPTDGELAGIQQRLAALRDRTGVQ